MNKNKKEVKNKSIFNIVLALIQTVLSVSILYLSKKVLPMKYWLIVVVIVVLLLAFTVIMFKSKKAKTKVRRLLNRLFSLIICILLAFSNMVAYSGLDVLNNITGGKYQTRVMSLAVLSSSSYNNIKDLNNSTISVVSSIDTENINLALNDINKSITVTTINSDSLNDLQSALINQEVDAILFNEAYRGIIEEFNKDFDGQTRIVYQFEIQEEVVSTTRDIDVTKDSFNIYISGIDTYGPVSTVSRSDVNMIMTVNPKTKQILLTSIPRDYYVQLASFGAYDKLTHAGIYGVEESMSTLENLFDIEIDYYARVNFTSLVTIVDAIGGITLDNPEAFYGYHTGEYFGAGTINLDGNSALEFTRERYNISGGDRARVVNQQRVLSAILNKVMSPNIISNYSSLLNAISGSFETTLESNDIQKIIQMQLDDMSSWTIEQISVDGSGSTSYNCYSMPGYGLYVMEPNYETVEAAKSKINELK